MCNKATEYKHVFIFLFKRNVFVCHAEMLFSIFKG